MKISFKRWSGMAGRYCVAFDNVHGWLVIQFFIEKDGWLWGYENIWYDGPHYSFGLGPILLISWRF